jgi:hypothetical protein
MDWMNKGNRKNMPGIPVALAPETATTLVKLNAREAEVAPAKDAMSDKFTIDKRERTAHEWLFNDGAGNPLESAQQFEMCWTNYLDVRDEGLLYLDEYKRTLTEVESANRSFWPMIAEHGLAYNLLMLRRVTEDMFSWYVRELGLETQLIGRFDQMLSEGRLYALDFSIFEGLKPFRKGATPLRCNPATVTLLERTAPGTFEPRWIRVWRDSNERGPFSPETAQSQYSPLSQFFSPGSWLYALQAAKSSVTLYGIWLGHVYHWHLVTAAMQRTIAENVTPGHIVTKLLDPHLSWLIPFDYVLLDGSTVKLFGKIAPPSCIGDPDSLLDLTDRFAEGRSFFDDDPHTELDKNGLKQEDFTRYKKHPWDMFPAAQKLLRIWDICSRYVHDVVFDAYSDDRAVASDKVLSDWMKGAASTDGANIRGLPSMDSRKALERVLTSLVYRVTAHGYSRLVSSANPALTFVANFPSCLQRNYVPSPSSELTESALLTYLPNTTTCGEMLDFYFAFSFSKPYTPLIPGDGVDTDLYFDDDPNNPRNRALLRFRKEMLAFMGPENASQWPRNIET